MLIIDISSLSLNVSKIVQNQICTYLFRLMIERINTHHSCVVIFKRHHTVHASHTKALTWTART